MKDLFKGFYHPTPDEIGSLWQNAVIVFDTNVLLDFYRVSTTGYTEMMSLFKSLSDRLWIPYHVAAEYHKNIFKVLLSQRNIYNSAIENLGKFKKALSEGRTHPYLEGELKTRLADLYKESNDYFNEQKRVFDEEILYGKRRDEIAKLYISGKNIGKADKSIVEIAEKEGPSRFQKEMPPGFKDAGKKTNKFGDLIVWKSMIDFSKTAKKPLLFVTSDTKTDWFYCIEGDRVVPDPRLLNEFISESGQHIYIYSFAQFLHRAKEQKIIVGDVLIEEISRNDTNLSCDEDQSDSQDSTSKGDTESVGVVAYPPKPIVEEMENSISSSDSDESAECVVDESVGIAAPVAAKVLQKPRLKVSSSEKKLEKAKKKI
jgi:hypothetical protein